MQAAIRFAAREATTTATLAGLSSASAAVLAEEAAKAMTIKKIATIAATLAAMLGLIGGGAAVLARQGGDKPADARKGEGPGVADASKPDEPKTDLEKLQGRWVRKTIMSGGQKLTEPAQPLGFQEIVIRGNQLLGTLEDGKLGAPRTLTLDASKPIKQFEWIRMGVAEREVTRGIYGIDGNALTVCYDVKDPSHAPADFSTNGENGRGNGRVTMAFERAAKPREPSGEEAAELAKLQGGWQYVGGEKDGEPFDAVPRQLEKTDFRLTFEGTRQFTRAGSDSTAKVLEGSVREISLDLTTNPPVMESRLSGEDARKRGLSSVENVRRTNYKVDGDTLIFCANSAAAAKGDGDTPEPRATLPGELVTRPGVGRVLSVFRRIKPDAGGLKQLQGTWEVVLIRDDGSDGKSATTLMAYVFEGETWRTVSNGGGDATRRQFKLDESRTPHVITFLRLDKTPPSKMIYRIDGDTLTLCAKNVDPHDHVPETFSAEKGEGQWLAVAKRTPRANQEDRSGVEASAVPKPVASTPTTPVVADAPTGEALAGKIRSRAEVAARERDALLDRVEDCAV